ncbi:N-acetylglucosaminyl deacetylase, LmbE family [Austwickia chelonae]|nr:N-acetylglucosaminyl deacetylase, LmbE family [Austwickia chelonae]
MLDRPAPPRVVLSSSAVVSTLIFLHAHPDDEASQTSLTMARAVAEGHRVVVVFATNGDHGEVAADLPEGMSVVAYRRGEAERSAQVIGTHRVAWLGYADSGMTGWAQNESTDCLHAADLDEAAGRLAAILDEEDADVLVTYDDHGGYGHPDHVKSHLVAHRAAALAARRPRLLESTMNRDHLRRLFVATRSLGPGKALEWNPDAPGDDGRPIGSPQNAIRYCVDGRDLIAVKRASLACHASQTSDVGMMLRIPEEHFREAFGFEWYLEAGRRPERTGPVTTWFLDDLPA